MKKFLLNNSWHDRFGNTLMFAEREGIFYMYIDGNECSEGIVEKIEPTFEEIEDVFKSYDYEELKKVFEESINLYLNQQ